MKLFQTILTALTTPNEGLMGIIFNDWGIPFIFIEIAVSALLFTQILNIKYSKKQFISYVLLLAFTSGISNSFLDKPYCTFVNMLSGIVLITVIFKTNFFKAILSEFIPLLITVVLETIFCKLFTLIFNIGYNDLYFIPLIRLLLALLIYLSIYFIYKISKHCNISIVLLDSMNKKNKYMLIINFVFAVFAMGMQVYIIVFYLNKLSLFTALASAISLIAYLAISIFSLLKTTKLEVTNKSLEEAKLYNKTLQILHDSIRCFKHDFSNIMQSIDGYIINNNMEGLKKYYSEIKDECDNLNSLTALNPNLINDSGLYSLIASKYHLAEQLNITFNISISTNFDEIETSSYILTRILGILLDNAIEAAKLSDEKEIIFEVTGPSENAKIRKSIISIANTYSNKDIDLDRIREKGYTSKTSDTTSHGLGLWEVNKILKKSKNLNLHTTKNNKYFTQQLEVFDIKSEK